MNVSEDDLALAAAGGDAQAFTLLMERAYDRLFRLAFRLTGRAEEAEDLTQDICAALPAKLQSYRGQARFHTWLYRVAMNAAIDRQRRRARYATALLEWGEAEVLDRAAETQASAEAAWLTQAMRHLPEAGRQTLALLLDGLSHAEIAEILEISEGTVSWRISEVKKHLRALSAEEERL